MGCVLVLLVLSLPLFAVCSLLVFLADGRPIFYRGVRLGKNKKVFYIYKFRSLVKDAESRIGNQILSERMADELHLEHRFGRFLRNKRLDELPQLINVLRGDMALVGPRPIRPLVYEKWRREIRDLDVRFQVAPGLIGPSQIYTPHSISHRIRSLLDNRYVRNRPSIFADLAFVCFVFGKLAHNLITGILTKICQYCIGNRHGERRRCRRLPQEQAFAVIVGTDTEQGRESSPQYSIGSRLALIDINDEALLLESHNPLDGERLVLRLEKQAQHRHRNTPKRRVAYVEARVNLQAIRRQGKELFQYVVTYNPVSPLNYYKIHQYFLEGSIA